MQTIDDQKNTKSAHGLGRGLDSLIPTGFDVDEKTEEATDKVEVKLIDPNPLQPRREFDEKALAELADSIRKYGIIQPLLVTKKGDRYELVAGERRLRAAKVVGLKEVPVVERTLEEQEKLEIAIIENLQRENLNPIELAMSYRLLMNQFNLNQEEVASKVGKARSTVANTMRLLSLPREVKQALAEGKISEGHARAIMGLEGIDKQIALFNKIIKEGLSVRDIECTVSVQKKPNKATERDSNILAAEKRLSEAMGTKVTIKRTGNSGKVVIDYYSFEDLERIFKKIVGN